MSGIIPPVLLPLITIKKENSPKYSVSFDSIKFLKSLKDKKIAILCLFDFESLPKRLITQKILKNKDIVQTKSQNIGISIWNQTLSLSADTELLVLESEGLDNCDEQDLLNMIVVCNILSSVVCINTIGDLDEKTFNKLRFLTHLPEKILCKKKRIFSDLLLLCQNSKDLTGLDRAKSQDMFLNFLSSKEKNSDSLKLLKKQISKSFCNKTCFGFDKSPSTSQLSGFQELLQSLITYKNLDGKVINGPMIYKLSYEVLEYLKKGAPVNISEVEDQIFSSESKEILEDIKKDFLMKIKSELSEEESPYDNEEIEKIFKLGYHDYSNMIDSKLKNISELDKFIELKNDFNETYDREFDSLSEQNTIRSKEFCEEILSKFFSNIAFPEINSIENIKPTLIREIEEDFQKLLDIYMNNARGPHKLQALFENMSNFLFARFQKLYENIIQIYTQENNKTKIFLLQTKEERDKLQNSIKELENLRFEAEQLKENISRESESLKREFDYKLLSKDYNEESLRNTLESKEKLIKKKKDQKRMLKMENAKFRENELKLKHEMNVILNEISNLKKKNKEYERIFDEESYALIRDLKGKLNSVEDQLQKKPGQTVVSGYTEMISTSNASVDDLEEELKHKELEIEKLKREKKALKDELSQKLDQESKRFNKLKEFLNNEIENLKKEKDEMNKKMITFDNRDQEVKNLQTENIKKDQQIEFLNHLLELNKQQIESIVCEIADIKQANGDLKQFKDSIPFILSEGLRYAMKQTKSNKIDVSLKTMKDEDAKLISKIFEEADFDVFSTKQSNYYPNEEFSPSCNITNPLKSSKTPSFPIKSSFLTNKNSPGSIISTACNNIHSRQKKSSSFKDDIKVSFYQQPQTLGDESYIDPITNRPINMKNENIAKNVLKVEKSLTFEFNSIDFSKPFPLPSNDSLKQGIMEDIRNNISKPTELDYTNTNSKELISFTVSPLTTNITERAHKAYIIDETTNNELLKRGCFKKNLKEMNYDENNFESVNTERFDSEYIPRYTSPSITPQDSADFLYNKPENQENTLKMRSNIDNISSPHEDDIDMMENLHEEEDITHIFSTNREDIKINQRDGEEDLENSMKIPLKIIRKSVKTSKFTEENVENDSYSPKFNNNTYKSEFYDYEIENYIGSNQKQQKEEYFKPKKLIFEEIAKNTSPLKRKKKEKQFSFAENQKNYEENYVLYENHEKCDFENFSNFLYSNGNNSGSNKATEKVYETILHRIFNEKTTKTKVPLVEKKSKKAEKTFKNTKTEKKLNRKEMSSYIEKIMSEAHRFKENKENQQNQRENKENQQNHNKNCKSSNLIIITNNTNGFSGKSAKKSNIFQLDISNTPPLLIPLNKDNNREKNIKNRRFSCYVPPN